MSDSNYSKEKFEEGMADFASQNYVRSIERLSEAIKIKPDFSLALKSRGAAFLRLDKFQDAISDFTKVVEMDPENARAFHLRGLAFEKFGENDKALDDFNRAIALNPSYGAAYHSRAILHTKMGHTDMATEDIQMVAQLTEINIEAFSNDNNVWRSQQLRLESMYNDNITMER